MDPFSTLVAFGPLAVYLFVIGWLNMSHRPTVVSGTRDFLALGLALVGLAIVGPLSLFMPLDAAVVFGPLVWLLLVAFYVLVVTFVLLAQRQRLVIYNVSPEVLRPVLGQVAHAIDPLAQWAGDSLALPSLGVELRIESTRAMRNVMLLSNHERQNPDGWRRLELSLRSELRNVQSTRSPLGALLVTLSAIVMVLLVLNAAADPAGVAQNFAELLRL